MPTDENGQIFMDESGKKVNPEERGWKKKLTAKILCSSEPYYEKVHGRPTQLVKKMGFIYRIYEVTCPKSKFYEQTGLDSTRLRIMPSGIVLRDFAGIFGAFGDGDFLEAFGSIDNKAYKLKSEKSVSELEILSMWSKGEIDIILDLSVRRLIEKKFQIKI